MTAASPHSLGWASDTDFHQQESAGQTNSWDNILFDPNLQHLWDQGKNNKKKRTRPLIYTSHLPTNSEDRLLEQFPVSCYKQYQENKPSEFEDIVLPMKRYKNRERKKHSFFNHALFRTK